MDYWVGVAKWSSVTYALNDVRRGGNKSCSGRGCCCWRGGRANTILVHCIRGLGGLCCGPSAWRYLRAHEPHWYGVTQEQPWEPATPRNTTRCRRLQPLARWWTLTFSLPITLPLHCTNHLTHTHTHLLNHYTTLPVRTPKYLLCWMVLSLLAWFTYLLHLNYNRDDKGVPSSR